MGEGREKWNLMIEKDGVLLKVKEVLTKEDCLTLSEALRRASETMIGIMEKRKVAYTNISARRFDLASQDVTPMRKEKKRENKGPY